MKIVVNNIKNQEIKLIMQKLMECVKNKSINIKDRNFYYSEYLKLAKDLIILSK